MQQLAHPDRVRAWLDALPRYRQGFGHLRQQDLGRPVAFCIVGVACDVARLAGAVIRVEADLADIIRCALDLDVHLVEDTAEHALAQLVDHEATRTAALATA